MSHQPQELMVLAVFLNIAVITNNVEERKTRQVIRRIDRRNSNSFHDISSVFADHRFRRAYRLSRTGFETLLQNLGATLCRDKEMGRLNESWIC